MQLYEDKNVKHTLAFSKRARAVNSQAAILSPTQPLTLSLKPTLNFH